MKELNIVDAGPRGAYEYHVRLYTFTFDFDRATKILTIEGWNEKYTFFNVEVFGFDNHDIILIGSEPVASGTGKVPPLRKIICS